MVRILLLPLLLIICLGVSAQNTTGFNQKFSEAVNSSDSTVSYRIELFTIAIDSFGSEGDSLDIPNYEAAIFNRSQLYLEVGENERAIQDLDQYITHSPENGRGYLKRGTTHYELDHFDRAREDFDHVIDRYLSDTTRYSENVIADVYNNRGVLNLRTERWEEACRDLQHAYEHGRVSLEEYIEENCR